MCSRLLPETKPANGPVGRLLLAAILSMLLALACGERARTVKITGISPSGEVSQTTNFTIEFSEEVMPDSLLGIEHDPEPLAFEPTIPGTYSWFAADKLRFYPEVRLLPSTEYTLTVSDRLLAGTGYRVKGKRRFEFHTPWLKVVDASLLIEFLPHTNEEARLRGFVNFNYPVDPVAAEAYLSLRYEDGGSIPITMETDEPSTTISVAAARVRREQEESAVVLVVREGLGCIEGNVPLQYEYREPLTMPGQVDLRVEEVQPEYRGPVAAIRIGFNLPVATDEAARRITVEPRVDFTIHADHRRLTLRGPFEGGKIYQVTVDKGLRAIDGSPMTRDFSTAIAIRKEDIPPQVTFSGDGFYLTRGGNLNIALATINVDTAIVEVNKIFHNNLTYLVNQVDLAADRSYYSLQPLGREVDRFKVGIEITENDEVTTPISVADYISEHGRGIYNFVARSSKIRWSRAMRWVVATDIGLVAKESGDQLWVWANSLLTLEPIRNAEIRLISRNNQVLATARTNTEGIAILDPLLEPARNFDPYLVTATTADDFSFLELDKRVIPTGSVDVGGRPNLLEGYDAFLYGERGIYRPGEIAHLAAFIRDPGLEPPDPFPVRLTVTAPDNRTVSEQRATPTEGGAVEFSVPLPDYSLTGSYTAMLTIGEDTEIGRTDFSVEDFIPDRMKVKVATEADGYRAGDTIDIKVEALTLFGPPAAGRHVKAGVEVVDYEFTPSGWEGFTFSNPRLSFESESFDLGEADLDDEGRHVFRFGVPTTLKPPAALRGIISATVLEPGGRAVTDHREVDIHPYSRYVGIRRTASGYAEINQLAELDYVLTTPEGRAIEDQQLKVSFYRIVWQSILRNTGRRGYRYVSERVEELQQEFTVRSESGGASFDVTPTDYGRYLVVVEDPATSASAAIYFYVSGWGYAPWAMDEPDRVELGLDRETYRAGEQATLQIRAPFSGKLLLTVERDEVYEHRVLVLEENTATLTLPVRQEYKPNVYISAHLIQSTEDLEPNTPVRAFGVVPLKVNTEDHLLRVSLDTPEVIRPNRELTVDFQVEGLAGRPADITIAAVDEGILQLTDFGTPDPHGHFLGKRRLDVKSHDLYGMVLPEFESESSSSPGGTEMAAPRRLSPVAIQRVKPVAFWSGLVRTDADGRGEVRFRIPQFAGTVRLMAAAAVRDRFGNGESKVVVREPLQMTPTLPRFLAGRDEFRVPVAVYNGMGRAAEVTVGLAVDGPVEVVGEGRHTLTITADAEEVVYFDARAGDGMGKITFTLTAEAGGERSEIKTDVPLRPPVPVVTLAGSGVASDGEPGQFTFPGGWVEGTAKFGVTSTAFPTVRFSAGLQYLFRYPHGCVEQTVSRLFPMLYFRELARLVEPELFRNNSAEYFIAEGLTKLEAMQLGNGAFSYWPRGNYTNDWSTLYATHFLIEARRAGYEVSDRVYNKAVALLSGFARSYTGDKQHNLQVAAYSCYLASLAGKPERSSMNYLKDSAADEMRESSLYQLAGAFGLAGDMVTARSLLPKAAAPPAVSAEREDGGNFNSPVRAQAVCLDVLAEIAPQHPMVPPLVEALTEAAGEDRRWRNTQENAFALMALGKILRGEEGGSFTGRLEVAGREIGSFDTRGAEFSGTGWDGDSALVRITGEGRCFYYWRADGLPADRRIEESDRDLEVRRRFLSEEGEPLDYADIGQGDLVVAEVTARTTAGSLENVAIVDLLPAGLEIENPRLESRRTLPWVKKAGSRPLYLDFRDDRIVFYDNLRQGKEYVYYYSLRAVTAGRFILPPIRAEAMYAPMKSSVASSGNITVRTAR